jgi:hypothetical protein
MRAWPAAQRAGRLAVAETAAFAGVSAPLAVVSRFAAHCAQCIWPVRADCQLAGLPVSVQVRLRAAQGVPVAVRACAVASALPAALVALVGSMPDSWLAAVVASTRRPDCQPPCQLALRLAAPLICGASQLVGHTGSRASHCANGAACIRLAVRLPEPVSGANCPLALACKPGAVSWAWPEIDIGWRCTTPCADNCPPSLRRSSVRMSSCCSFHENSDENCACRFICFDCLLSLFLPVCMPVSALPALASAGAVATGVAVSCRLIRLAGDWVLRAVSGAARRLPCRLVGGKVLCRAGAYRPLAVSSPAQSWVAQCPRPTSWPPATCAVNVST